MVAQPKRRILRWLGLLLPALIIGMLWVSSNPTDVPQSIATARKLLVRRDYEKALQECQNVLSVAPGLSEALLLKGECLQRLGRLEEAMSAYSEIENDGSESAVAARLTEASVFLPKGEIEKCLSMLDIAEKVSPDADALVALKASALTASGRRWESMPYLRKSLDAGVGDTLANLIYLAVPDQMPQPNEKYLELVVQNKDTIGAIGAARVAMALGLEDRAATFLNLSRKSHPELPEVYIQQATLFLNANRRAEFLATILSGGAELESHPEFWLLLGRYSQETGSNDVATRCYWEVLKRHPDQDRACYQLGQLLSAFGRLEDSRLFIERAGRLAKLVEKASILYDNPSDKASMLTCAELTYGLGRYRESQYWCKLLLEERPSDDILNQVMLSIERLQKLPDLSWQDPALNVAAHVDLESFPLPDLGKLRKLQSDREQSPEKTDALADVVPKSGNIRFSDDAESAGLRFAYRNGSDAETAGRRMFEYTGGGAAAFDLDHDGYDDVHMTQGTDWPPDRQQSSYVDQTFRNVRGESFANITAHAGLADSGFSQGVSSGDFDNDGFPDLYVGNIAGNTLYRNNGDGTFTDVTSSSGVGHQHWSTSCAVVDLNGDSLPDLYDVTFLQGSDVFTKICDGEDGIPRSCSPAAFEAAPDFIWENLGDGTFRLMPADSGFDIPDGDGLGILVSDFDQSGRLSIFLANDGRANFFYVPMADKPPFTQWKEIGVINGTAFDAVGQAQACMGVAAADFDKNGLLDLFVTNFYQESNTLYVNMGTNTFLDQSRRFGLHDPSYAFLGFGTQFLDADLDSWQDLVVANGHVDDFRHKNIPYRMKPQFFQNDGGERFEEIAQESIGPFFASEHMGRGMARMDWNRDFLVDVVISQLDEPAALLTNQTTPLGRGTGLRLVDKSADRDAIGTRVVVESENDVSTYFLTAGDGYQSSNSRELVLATPAHISSFTVRVYWKSGVSQLFKNVMSGQRYTAISGRDQLLNVP